MRAVGIDLGSKRIGVSTSDASGTLASPHSVIQRGGARSVDHDAIKLVVDEYEAEVVVVGLPVSMNGQMLQVVSDVVEMAKSGDLILTLGAGDVSSLGDPILQALATRFT